MSTVTVFLRGGLGNQMFQYAAGLALAKRNGGAFALDTVYLGDRWPRRNFTYRTYDLDIFGVRPKFTTLSHCAQMVPLPGLWLAADLAAMQAAQALGTLKIVKEKSEDAFDGTLLHKKGNIVLWGRWQDERYFKDAENELRDAFAFKYQLKDDAAALAEKIGESESISVHVRRGDYAAFKNVATMMGDTDLSYYARAARHIIEHAHLHAPKFFVFSDDIEWCKANLMLGHETVYVPESAAGPKASFHLELMSLCRHHIVANSTFSWWGAWLDPRPESIVVAPARWYAGKAGGENIVPARWIKA